MQSFPASDFYVRYADKWIREIVWIRRLCLLFFLNQTPVVSWLKQHKHLGGSSVSDTINEDSE